MNTEEIFDASTPISIAAELWVNMRHDGQEITEATAAGYRRNLARMANDLGPDRPVGSITSPELRLWQSKLRKRDGSKYDPGALNTLMAGPRAFWADAYLDGAIESDPAARVKRLKAPKKYPKVADTDAVVALMREANAEERLLILLMVQAGSRRFEAAKMRIEHVDLANLMLLFHEGKGKKTATVPICVELADAIRLHIESLPRSQSVEGPLFPSKRFEGQPMSKRTVNAVFDRLSQRAGVKVTPHSLRHLFSLSQQEDGHPTNAVMKLMRHASLTSLTDYSQLRPEQLRPHASQRRYDGPRLRAVGE